MESTKISVKANVNTSEIDDVIRKAEYLHELLIEVRDLADVLSTIVDNIGVHVTVKGYQDHARACRSQDRVRR